MVVGCDASQPASHARAHLFVGVSVCLRTWGWRPSPNMSWPACALVCVLAS